MTTTLESLDAKLDEILSRLKAKKSKYKKKTTGRAFGSRATKINEFLANNPGEWNSYQIAKAIGEVKEIAKVGWSLSNMAKRNHIVRVASGVYSRKAA